MCSSGATHATASYTSNGKTDWYLPTASEMQNVVSTFATYGATNGVVNLVQNSNYWTSFEQASAYAHVVNTGTNQASMEIKSATWNVRPVRAFTSLYTPQITTSLVNYSLGTSSYEYAHAPFDVTRPTSMSGGLISLRAAPWLLPRFTHIPALSPTTSPAVCALRPHNQHGPASLVRPSRRTTQ